MRNKIQPQEFCKFSFPFSSLVCFVDIAYRNSLIRITAQRNLYSANIYAKLHFICQSAKQKLEKSVLCILHPFFFI